MAMRDYYGVLGVSVGSTPDQIRRAYQRLARRYSPDVNLWEQQAHSLFEEISQAYRVLSDPSARRLYDQHGPTPAAAPDAPAEAPAGRRGDDLHAPVEVSFAQAHSGLALDLSVERLSPCETCRAAGVRPGAPMVRCDHCAGAGLVWARVSGRVAPSSCPACGGAGQRAVEVCLACRGRGVRPRRESVPVAIPAGMDTAGQVRVAGQGHAGPLGGPRGDLVVIARVQDHPVFTRKGDNLHAELPVSMPEAALGARIPLATLNGPIDVSLPAGMQNGQVIRIRGKGMPRLSGEGRGDLHVTVVVETPRGIDARTQELFRELGRLLPEPPRGALRRQEPQ